MIRTTLTVAALLLLLIALPVRAEPMSLGETIDLFNTVDNNYKAEVKAKQAAQAASREFNMRILWGVGIVLFVFAAPLSKVIANSFSRLSSRGHKVDRTWKVTAEPHSAITQFTHRLGDDNYTEPVKANSVSDVLGSASTETVPPPSKGDSTTPHNHKYCSQCGTQCAAASIFCTRCGTRIS